MASLGSDLLECELPRHFVIEKLEHLLEQKFPQEKYTYDLFKATTKGDNYMGIVYRVKVHFFGREDENGSLKEHDFSLILKIPPNNEERRKQFFVRPSFLREALAYEEFLPLLADFQKSKNPEHIFTEYAECYLTLTDENNEAIFLEDLSYKGFLLFDRFDEMNVKHVQIVIRTYAKLHASSFALKDQRPKEFDPFKRIPDWFDQRKTDKNLRLYFESLKISTLDTLDKENDTNNFKILKIFFDKGEFYDLLLPLMNCESSEPYAIVCHGDCWNNNILFKYKDTDIIDIRLIDWQLMRYASPVTDLMYFIFTCTTKNFRDRYFLKTMDYYYEQLAMFIKSFGSDPNKMYPREVFNKQLKSFGAVGLLLSMFILPITLQKLDANELEDLGDAVQQGIIPENKDEILRKRLREVIIDSVEYGFI